MIKKTSTSASALKGNQRKHIANLKKSNNAKVSPQKPKNSVKDKSLSGFSAGSAAVSVAGLVVTASNLHRYASDLIDHDHNNLFNLFGLFKRLRNEGAADQQTDTGNNPAGSSAATEGEETLSPEIQTNTVQADIKDAVAGSSAVTEGEEALSSETPTDLEQTDIKDAGVENDDTEILDDEHAQDE